MKNQPRHFEKEPHHQKLRYIILVTLTGFTKTRRIVSLNDFIFQRRLRDSYSECPPICWPGNLDLQVKVLRKIMRTYFGLLRTYSPFLLSLLALKSVIFFSIDVVFSIGISNLYVSTIQVLLNQVETTNKKDLKISYNATVVAEFCKSLWWISANFGPALWIKLKNGIVDVVYSTNSNNVNKRSSEKGHFFSISVNEIKWYITCW